MEVRLVSYSKPTEHLKQGLENAQDLWLFVQK